MNNRNSVNSVIHIPINLITDNHTYKKKQELENNVISYRCKHRDHCNGLIHVKKESIELFLQSPLLDLQILKTVKKHKLLCP